MTKNRKPWSVVSGPSSVPPPTHRREARPGSGVGGLGSGKRLEGVIALSIAAVLAVLSGAGAGAGSAAATGASGSSLALKMMSTSIIVDAIYISTPLRWTPTGSRNNIYY